MKNIIIFLVFFFLFTTKLYAADKNLADLQKELDNVTKQFESIEPSNLEEAVVFDNSIKEINKAVEFVQQSLENENPDIALKAVTFVKKSLSDISAILPKNYDSDMSNADMTSLGEETLKEVTNVTEGLAKKTKADTAKLISTMLDVNDAGFNVFDISKNLNSFGVETIKMQLDVKTREEMSQWTKEEWETAWTGGVLTDDGEKIITDEEAETRLLELNAKLESIKETDTKRANVQNNINNLNKQLSELNTKKNSSINQIESNKLSLEKQIELINHEIEEENKILNTYNEKIVNLDKQIENINSLTSSIKQAENDVNLLKDETVELNKAAENINKQIKENNDKITNLQKGVYARVTTTRDLKTKYDSWEHNTITYDNRRLFDATLEQFAASQDISIDLNDITDEKRIEYYDQYKEIFDAEKRWTNTTNKKNATDNLKLDGTASGFIERQKKVLAYKNNYEAWNNSISMNQEQISKEASVNTNLSLELENVNNKITSTNEILSTKQANLDILQKNITDFNFKDERYEQISDLESEKKLIFNNTENQNNKLKKELEDQNTKIVENLSTINSLQNDEIEINNRLELLNEKITTLAKKKDLITINNRTDIQKEVEAFNNFGHILANSAEDEKIADIEIEYALNHADVILSGDSKRHQVFDLEKYGKIAGLSADLINKGKSAINNDDWDTQKQVYSKLFTSLAKNKNYKADVSAAELNVMVAEQKLENEIIDLVRSNPTNINFDYNLNSVYWPKGSVPPSSFKEAVDVAYDQILDNPDYTEKLGEFEKLKKDFTEGNEWLKQANVTMGNLNNEIVKLTSEGKLDEANLVRNMLNKDILSKFNNKYREVLKAQSEMGPASMAVSKIQGEANKQAYDSIWELNNQISETQKKAVNDLNKMIDVKLSTIPTYDQNKINSVKKMIFEISPDSTVLLIDPSSELFAAKAKAILYDDDGKMLQAFDIANDTRAKSFNYTSDRTNVELAAEIQSTLNGTYSSETIDGYMTAKYYQGSIIEKIERFTPTERREVTKEFEIFFSNKKDSPLIKNLDNKIDSLKEEINSTASLKDSISNEIIGLGKQIEKINSSHVEIQKEISDLNLEIQKNEGFFKKKELELSNSFKEIDPINFALNKLTSEKNSIQNQIETKTIELNKKRDATGEIDENLKSVISELKAKEIEFDQQINPLKIQQTQLISEVQVLTDEVNAFNKSRPQFEKKITDLEEDIIKLKNTKADLATAQAQNIGIEVDKKAIESIDIMEDTAIIALNGPALVRVVDATILVEEAEFFKAPISEFSINPQIYTAAAVRPEELFAVRNITGEIKVALSEGTVKEINSGSLGFKTEKVESAQTASVDQNITITDGSTQISTTQALQQTQKSSKAAQQSSAFVTTGSSKIDAAQKKAAELRTAVATPTITTVEQMAENVITSQTAGVSLAEQKVASAALGDAVRAQSDALGKVTGASAKTADVARSIQKETMATMEAAAQAQQSAAQAQQAATQAVQVAVVSASRQAAEAAAVQVAQAAAAQQAQHAALQAAQAALQQVSKQATQTAAQITASAAETATSSQSLQEARVNTVATEQASYAAGAALISADKAVAENNTKATRAAAVAAKAEVMKTGAARVQAAAAEQAAQAARIVEHNAIAVSKIAAATAKAAAEAAAEIAATELAQAATEAAKAAAKASQVAAVAAAQNAQIQVAQARVAELQSILQDRNTIDKINAQMDSQTFRLRNTVIANVADPNRYIDAYKNTLQGYQDGNATLQKEIDEKQAEIDSAK